MGPRAVMGSLAGYECRTDTPTHSLSLFLSLLFLSLWPPPPFTQSLYDPLRSIFFHSSPTLFLHFVCFISIREPLIFPLLPPPWRFPRGRGPCSVFSLCGLSLPKESQSCRRTMDGAHVFHSMLFHVLGKLTLWRYGGSTIRCSSARILLLLTKII